MQEKQLTPMMEQYLVLKQQHQDEVLFFRLGDFYEMFLDDAKEVSQLLNITLTSRNGVPMCGIPYHAARNYIKRLLDAGKKIAICEQTSLPTTGKTIAKREVVQIITPGTVVEDEFLDAASHNHILAIALDEKQILCAYSELSSGVFSVQELPREPRFDSLRALIEQLQPKEILINEDDYFGTADFAQTISHVMGMVTRLPAWYFSRSQAFSLLCEHFESISLKQFGLADDAGILMAAGALFRYLKETAQASLAHITALERVDRSRYLLIDESTRKNLELLRNLQEGTTAHTLFSAINATCTAGGARLLKSWIANPLAEISPIAQRQDHVAWFVDDDQERHRVRSILSSTRDLSRLVSRVTMHRANPQDLVAIGQSIASFFTLTEVHTKRYRTLLTDHVSDNMMENLVTLMETLMKGIREECQGPYIPGKVIAKGFSESLDALRELQHDGDRNLRTYVSELKEQTGIPTIKLSHNKIIGHFIEIPKTHSDRVPQWFHRKQTLVNAERYTTDQLIALETEILASGEQADEMERTLYEQLLSQTATLHEELMLLGRFFSTIDCYQSMAQCATLHHYCRPEVTTEDILQITAGRHPVVEQALSQGEFVTNGLSMGGDDERFCLITGPNMAGKSTYLRQNALIVLLAHIGSYVPADAARIGLTDKLFCRVGASDNLARGESTFLIEMQEAAGILRTATSRSLAIMDEIGRGTSTQDGMSIAYAVMREMVRLQVKTLFATHYHELTMLDTADMQLLTLAVAESRKSIVFLRKIQPGVADSSYGLHVAKMAGIPLPVIREAAQFQKQHFADYELKSSAGQLDLFTGSPDAALPEQHLQILESLRSFDLNESTPLEALQFIAHIQHLIDEADMAK